MSFRRFLGLESGESDANLSAHPVVCGLANVSNSCFLNSVLQALAGSRLFVTFITEHASEVTDPTTLQNKHPKPLTPVTNILKTLIQAINCIQGESTSVLTPYQLTKKLRSSTHLFDSAAQEDAHELLQAVLALLDTEDEKLYKSTFFTPSLKDLLSTASLVRPLASQQDVECPAAYSLLDTPMYIPVRVVNPLHHRNPFVGWLSASHACLECGSMSDVKCSPFNNLSIAIPNSFRSRMRSLRPSAEGQSRASPTVQLQDCLNDFTKWDYADGVECAECTRRLYGADCDLDAVKLVRTRVRRRMWIGRAPKSLCLHIKRLIGYGTTLQKIALHVEFPTEFDVTPFLEMPRTARRQSSNQDPDSRRDPVAVRRARGTTVTLTQPQLTRRQTVDDDDPIIVPPTVSGDRVGDGSRGGAPRLSRPSRDGSGSNPNPLYKLSAVVAHLGSATSGHFVTYRQPPSHFNAPENVWLCCSDAVVTIVSLQEVLSAQAYMLFYDQM